MMSYFLYQQSTKTFNAIPLTEIWGLQKVMKIRAFNFLKLITHIMKTSLKVVYSLLFPKGHEISEVKLVLCPLCLVRVIIRCFFWQNAFELEKVFDFLCNRGVFFSPDFFYIRFSRLFYTISIKFFSHSTPKGVPACSMASKLYDWHVRNS